MCTHCNIENEPYLVRCFKVTLTFWCFWTYANTTKIYGGIFLVNKLLNNWGKEKCQRTCRQPKLWPIWRYRGIINGCHKRNLIEVKKCHLSWLLFIIELMESLPGGTARFNAFDVHLTTMAPKAVLPFIILRIGSVPVWMYSICKLQVDF